MKNVFKLFLTILVLTATIFFGVSSDMSVVFADSGDSSLFEAIKSELNNSSPGQLISSSNVNASIPKEFSTFGMGYVNDPSSVFYANATTSGLNNVKNQWSSWFDEGTGNPTYKAIFGGNLESKGGVSVAPKDNENHDYYACFPRIDTYGNNWVDLKGQVIDYRVTNNSSNNYPNVSAFSITDGSRNDSKMLSVHVLGLDYIRVKWTFTVSNGSCTGAPITVRGNTSFWDVDNNQGIVYFDNAIRGLFVTSDNVLNLNAVTWKNADNVSYSFPFVYTVNSGSVQSLTKANSYTEIFEGSEIDRTYSFYEKGGSAHGGTRHDNISVVNNETPPPVKSVDIDYADYRSNFTYRVRQDVPLQHSDYYYSSFFMQDTLDPCHDMTKTTTSNVKVLNITQGGADVTSLFDITIEGTTVRATAKPAYLATAGFYGNLYELVIPAGVKLGTTYSDTAGRYDYSKYPKDSAGYYIVKNQPVTYINNSPLTGNEVQIKVAPAPEKAYGGTSYADNKGWNHHEVAMPDARQKRAGDDIKYKITIAGVNSDEIITITDVLSKGLTYNGDAAINGGTLESSSDPLVNSETKTTSLMWQVKIPKGTIATFTYSAKVNEDAVNLVNNDAKVKYGNSDAIDVGTLSNPVPKKAYDSDTANGMNGKIIQNGDVITYNISYANGFKEKANINLKDTLSKDLKYKEKTAKICDANKENCKSLDEAGVTESITANEDGTTTIIWNDKNVESLQVKTIVYDVEAQGSETRVQNNFDIQICKASEQTCNNPYTDIDELKNPKPKKEYAPEPNDGFDHRAVRERSRIKYQITYENVEEDKVTVTIKDNISKGIEYVRGTFEVDGKKIKDPTFSNKNKTFTLQRELEKDQKEVLTYEVLVTGETTKVNNKATAEYSNNPGYVRQLNILENPVPQKTYADNTKAGKNGALVKKGDVITYSIKFSNLKKEASSVIIMDNLSKGIEYVPGSAKINGKKLDPVSSTKDANGQMLVWMKQIDAGKDEELTYDVKVNGEKLLVENNASIQYDNDPIIKLDELRNPLVNKQVVNVPDTGSTIAIAGVIVGLALVSGGGYILYRKYKHA